MQRLLIMEKTCACPLYDKTWSWKSDQRHPSALPKLVMSLIQFASEFDGKDASTVTKVSFEASVAEKKRPTYGYGGRASTRTRRASAVALTTMKTIDLYSMCNEWIRISIFVDPSDFTGNVEDILRTVNEAFLRDFKTLLTELKPQFEKGKEALDESMGDEKFVPRFDAFSEVIEKLSLAPPPKAYAIKVAEAKLDEADEGKSEAEISLALEYD